MRRSLIAILVLWGFAKEAPAGTIVLSGTITQSTADGTGPAINNSALNDILDGQAYTVTLNFAVIIAGPGIYNATSVLFNVPSAPASETACSRAKRQKCLC